MNDAQLIIVDKTDSTNTAAKRQFSFLADGSLYCALEQSAGRGRLGRKWVTLPGLALTASGVFKRVSEPFHAGAVIALAGLDMVREAVPGIPAFFKWPNDIYIRECKLAGILSEGVLAGGRFEGVVSGIGINVNQNSGELARLDNPATSLLAYSGENFDVKELYRRLFYWMTLRYQEYCTAPEQLIGRWREENALTGEVLEIIRPDGGRLHGRFAGIAPDGAMMLECGGEISRFDCGDVKIDTGTVDFEAVEIKVRANLNR